MSTTNWIAISALPEEFFEPKRSIDDDRDHRRLSCRSHREQQPTAHEPIRKSLLTVAVTLLSLIAEGCGAVYRPPKQADYFRAAPLQVESIGSPDRPEKGVPLPVFPPATEPNPQVAPANTPMPLTLDDAIRISLSNSGIVRVAAGGTVTASPASPYDPQIADALIRVPQARFDPILNSVASANWINHPSGSVFGPGLVAPNQRNDATALGNLTKTWLPGTETRVGYNPSTGYLFRPNYSGSSFNPLYTSNLEWAVKQPLLKGGGIKANKAPIRIAYLRRDQSALTTRQAVMASVRSVAEAYWELSSSQNTVTALEAIAPLLKQAASIEREKMAAQRSVAADVAKIDAQLHQLMQQIVAAKSAVVQSELRLRNLIGVPPNDGFVFFPSTPPLGAPVQIDVSAATSTAIENRPDVIRQASMVRTRECELLIARNAALPQLDLLGLNRWNGVGGLLDDSLSQMSSAEFADYQVSLTLTAPIGLRAGAATIRAATLQLKRESALMEQAVHATAHQVSSLAQEASYSQQLYAEAEIRTKSNAEWLSGARIRFENPPPAGDGQDWLLAALNDYLLAMRSQSEASIDAQTFLARYNIALARLSEATGTILNEFDIQTTHDESKDTATGTFMP